MISVRARKIIGIAMVTLAFVFEELVLYTDHKDLFDTLVLISIILGVAIYPADLEHNRKAKIIAAISILAVITIMLILLAVFNLP